MALCFYKKHIRCQMMNKNGKMILGCPLLFSHGKSNSFGVAIGYCGTETFKVVNTAWDKNVWIIILNAELNGTNFLLINFYNSNTESEQLSTFSALQKLLEKVDDYNKKILFLEVILIGFLVVSLMRLVKTQY